MRTRLEHTLSMSHELTTSVCIRICTCPYVFNRIACVYFRFLQTDDIVRETQGKQINRLPMANQIRSIIEYVIKILLSLQAV